MAVDYYCGGRANGRDIFEFLAEPPEGFIVCARCEEMAVAAGMPPSDEIVGHHVHKGGVKAKQTCCQKAVDKPLHC